MAEFVDKSGLPCFRVSVDYHIFEFAAAITLVQCL